MKTRGAIKVVLMLAGPLAMWGCASNHKPHYGGTKTYGKATDVTPDDHSADAEIDPSELEEEFEDEPAEAPKARTEPSPGPLPPPAPAPAPAPTPAPPAPGQPTDPDVEEEETPEDPVIAPETLINHERYGAAFNADSAIGIRDDRGYRSLGILANRVKESLTTTSDDGMIVSQNFGDGTSRSTVTQSITNIAADANRMPGTPTTSGDQIMDRVVDATCPSVFVCIGKLLIQPLEGAAKTFCFTNPTTGARVLFPYGAAPNYKAADFALAYGDYGPYDVKGYAGADVDCNQPETEPLAEERVNVEVRAGSVAEVPFYLHKIEVIPPQYAVTFKTARVNGDLVSPYIDETVSLNHVANYVMNEDVRQMVSLVVTSRQSIDIAQQTGGGIFGGIAGMLINLDGVQVDLHFELCQDYLDARAPATHCVPPPGN